MEVAIAASASFLLLERLIVDLKQLLGLYLCLFVVDQQLSTPLLSYLFPPLDLFSIILSQVSSIQLWMVLQRFHLGMTQIVQGSQLIQIVLEDAVNDQSI